ncbi:hypothetical protein A3L09_08265 [Thermococcus profundus]|uniref:Uncharacterized protein n=1 Tax=Thermococcus profundus TaxID=49899 RepID=A0A2Z2MGC6_THEPR|nr:hypothetical protein [Thermococcus profundus]ASJ03775.1 hypothetical protein A3L09_08265 [Thermococcus profundus]
MGRWIYQISVVLTAISLFWPIIYGNVSALRRLPGNPVLQAVAGVLLFGAIAYITFEEGEEMEEGITAS